MTSVSSPTCTEERQYCTDVLGGADSMYCTWRYNGNVHKLPQENLTGGVANAMINVRCYPVSGCGGV